MGNLAALLVPLLMGGLLFTNLWDDDEDDAAPAPEPEPEPEPEPDPEPEPEPEPEPDPDPQPVPPPADPHPIDGDDTLTAGDGFSGNLEGGGGDDVLTANGGDASDARPEWTPDNMLEWFSNNDYALPPTVIDGVIALRGGEGADILTATGAGIDVDGGAGADRLDLSGMTQGIVRVGAGDSLVAAPTSADTTILWSVDRGASLDLGTAGGGQSVDLIGEGAHVTGSAHDDHLTTEGGNVTLSGGAGNDRMVGNYDPRINAPSHAVNYDTHLGRGHDLLDGGDGDDTIEGDAGDTVTGGAGADDVSLWLDPGAVAHVTDFDPAEDSLTLHVDATDGSAPGAVTSAEVDGNTVIRLGGQDVLVIEGRTGLSVGVNREEEGDQFGNDSGYQDLAGNTVDPATVNVVVQRYTPYY